MFITGKHLGRRTFLKGAGAAIALPMLDAMTPALARAGQTAQSPTRLAFAYIPNGATMAEWTPSGEGADYKFSRILKSFEPYRQDLMVVSGLGYERPRGGRPNADGVPGGHATAGSLYLTGVKPKKTIGLDVRAGVSVDQVAAQSIGDQTRFPSLELSCDDTRSVGNCDSGYSCVYNNTISWRSPTSPMPPETNPRMLFERLFGAEDLSIDPATRARRADYRQSILDSVAERASSLMNTLGASDRRKVDEYLYGVREIEKRINSAEQESRQIDPEMEKPSGIPTEFAEHLRLMFDLQVLALQADLTRVMTLMIGREGSLRTYPEIGVRESHHPLTHHRNNPVFIEKVTQINCYHTELFTYFLEKLKSTDDGDGTLMDHSMVVYGSGISNGDNHAHYNLPTVVFGKGSGALKPGQHLVYKDAERMTRLHLSLLSGLGVHPDNFGEEEAPLSEVMA